MASFCRISLASLLVLPLMGQRNTAELRLLVTDPANLPLEATVLVESQVAQHRATGATDRQGRWTARNLPFGPYRIRVERAQFAPYGALIDLRSEVPFVHHATLAVATIETLVTVTDADTLLDPYSTGSHQRVGAEALRDRRSTEPSRAVLDQVQSQPGWVLEAGGILHPRGAEYGTQYVVDGIPIQDNRSPGFAPALEIEDLESLNVMTGNYPAEYGRKLGGVIEVAPERRPGSHGQFQFQAGSFDALHSSAGGQIEKGRTALGLGVEGWRTDRFLDPPTPENFTNHGSSGGAHLRLEHDFSSRDRLRISVSRRDLRFLVPNEPDQQEAGQRQDRTSGETIGQVSFQHVFSPRLVANVRGMVRDLDAALWSNALSMPIRADQERGFREGYVNGSASYLFGRHEWKAGFETIHTALNESFSYQITRRRFFDGDIPRQFALVASSDGSEQALFLQDRIRAGPWTLSLGMRWDRYRLVIRDSAFSPRIGISYYVRAADLVLRGSYDRAFQTPANENLLLASSREAQHLTDETTGSPVPASRGDFYQAGFSKGIFGKVRLDGTWFRRDIGNFADDDVFLNTGVSFPIAFRRAQIHGAEAKLSVPRWGRFSGYLSYGNLTGVGYGPITGGLFLESDSGEVSAQNRFAITQDQRNTLSGRVRFQIHPRASLAFGGWYGSGLPVELGDDADLDDADPRILQRVNFERGRVLPSHSLDLSGAVDLIRRDRYLLKLHGDVLNFTNRFNVINFAGLFSGTALASPRTAAFRLHFEF